MATFWRLFDTFILLAGLVYISIKYVMPALRARGAEISSTIEKAKEEEEKAKELLKAAEDKFNSVKTELGVIMEEALKEAALDRKNIIEEAGVSAGKMAENIIALAKGEVEKQKRIIYLNAVEGYFNSAVEKLGKELLDETMTRINYNLIDLHGGKIGK